MHDILNEDFFKMGLQNRTGRSCTVSGELMIDNAAIYEACKSDIAIVIAYRFVCS